MSSFVKNAWYVAAWSREIGRHLTARTILGENLVFWRRQDGTPAPAVSGGHRRHLRKNRRAWRG